jgi:hypothetical protein
MLRDSIDRGVSVCPLTVTDGWSGGGGFVCARAPAAIIKIYRLNLDVIFIAASRLWFDQLYVQEKGLSPAAIDFNYNVWWPPSEKNAGRKEDRLCEA